MTIRVKNWRKLPSLCAVSLGVGFIITLLLTTIAMGMWDDYAPYPSALGNHPETITQLEQKLDPDNFTFIVMGDVKQGTETFEELLDCGKRDRVDFAVVLGDFVSDPELQRHKHFAQEISERPMTYPVFLVAGNHDIEPGTEFDERDFADMYGASQCSFIVGDKQFIILNDVPPYDQTGGYCDYLEDTVRAQADRVRDVFVFMHVPPKGLNSQVKCRGLAHSERFMALCESLGVRYVFMGDHHGYVKTVKGPTTYIVTGGGGDQLRGDRGHFHHLTRICVGDGAITETVIETQSKPELIERIERNLSIHLWALMKRNIWSMLVTVCLSAGLFYLIIRLIRDWREQITISPGKLSS